MKADAPSAEKEALEWATRFFKLQADQLTREGSAKSLFKVAEHTALSAIDPELTPPGEFEPWLQQTIRSALVDADEFDTMVLSHLAMKYIAAEKKTIS